ncbi:MAG: hypothetical protein E4G98_00965 [Promethearchaeota archaeon]|nr:MAG: hypothetical protein E4G98_00965 [Candidatus Lokiarchaeota archaeon]
MSKNVKDAKKVTKKVTKKVSKKVPKKVSKKVPKEETKIVPKEETKIVPKEETKIVPKEETKIVPKNDTKIVPKKDTKIVPKKDNKKVPIKKIFKNTNFRVIMAAVLISMILTSSVTILILPSIFPGMKVDPAQIDQLQANIDAILDDPRILQTKYLQIEPDSAEIHDDATEWTKIAEDNISIFIGNNSQILVEYTTHYVFGIIDLDPGSRIGFEVQIQIVNVTVETQRIGHFSSEGYTSTVEFEGTLHMNLLTLPLLAGEYAIVMYWRSLRSDARSQYLIFSNLSVQYNRTLCVNEVVNYGM